jgi:hypothetical protein
MNPAGDLMLGKEFFAISEPSHSACVAAKQDANVYPACPQGSVCMAECRQAVGSGKWAGIGE